MLIKSRLGISADGFVSTPEGVPAIALRAHGPGRLAWTVCGQYARA